MTTGTSFTIDELHLRHPTRPVIQKSLFLWSCSHSWDTSITFFIFVFIPCFSISSSNSSFLGSSSALPSSSFFNPLPLAPNRSLPSPSIFPRATRWGSRGILSVSSSNPSSVILPRTRTGPLQVTNEIRAALDPPVDISVSFCTEKEPPAADSQMNCSSSLFKLTTRTLSETR